MTSPPAHTPYAFSPMCLVAFCRLGTPVATGKAHHQLPKYCNGWEKAIIVAWKPRPVSCKACPEESTPPRVAIRSIKLNSNATKNTVCARSMSATTKTQREVNHSPRWLSPTGAKGSLRHPAPARRSAKVMLAYSRPSRRVNAPHLRSDPGGGQPMAKQGGDR